MTRMRAPTTYADVMGMSVEYRGQNGAGQHLAANGSVLVTDTFDTIEELVKRFGKRINLHEKEMAHSGPYAAGIADAKAGNASSVVNNYRGMDKQEYGLGYIRGLLERPPPV